MNEFADESSFFSFAEEESCSSQTFCSFLFGFVRMSCNNQISERINRENEFLYFWFQFCNECIYTVIISMMAASTMVIDDDYKRLLNNQVFTDKFSDISFVRLTKLLIPKIVS